MLLQKKIFLSMVIGTALPAVANIDKPAAAGSKGSEAHTAQTIDIEGEIPFISARYATSVCALPCEGSEKQEWFFWRRSNRIEIRDARENLGELWLKDRETSQVTYLHLLPRDRKAIEYNPTDLRLLQHNKSWDQLASMISPAQLQSMTPVERLEVFGYQAVRYVSDQQGVRREVVWVPELHLATYVARRSAAEEAVTELVEMDETSPQQPTRAIDLLDYQIVDFADVGDMEHSRSHSWLTRTTLAPGHEFHDHHR